MSNVTRRRLPWAIGAMTFLAVGLESATGAWIASYSHRLHRSFEAPVEAASVFWFGLLVSRALYSTNFLRSLTERGRLRWPILIAAAGSTIMLGGHGQVLLLVAALLIGFGVGPIYPTLLGLTLPRVAGNIIFLLAGLGGSSFSWLTGMISGSASSLRVGMLVPAAAGALMLAISPSLFASLESLEEADCKAETTD
jgi:fucose permease